MSKMMETLRVNIMGDLTLPSLAQIIRSKGRGPDTMLAHITPKEAAMLKANGGAGTTNPETGLPEFYDGSEYYTSYGGYEGPTYPDYSGSSTFDASNISSSYEPSYAYQPNFNVAQPTYEPTYAYTPAQSSAGFDYAPEMPTFSYGVPDVARAVQVAQAPAAAYVPTVPAPVSPAQVAERVLAPEGQKPGFMEELMANTKKYLTQPENLGKLGTAALGALGGAKTAKAAQEQGQQAKQEMQQVGSPYAVEGQRLIQQAKTGELTPASAQALEAARARLAQGIESRGGVGVQQAANQLAMLRNELLQNQYDYGLKIMGISDNISLGAIKAGLQADQYVNELTNRYYTNIARTIYGSATQGA